MKIYIPWWIPWTIEANHMISSSSSSSSSAIINTGKLSLCLPWFGWRWVSPSRRQGSLHSSLIKNFWFDRVTRKSLKANQLNFIAKLAIKPAQLNIPRMVSHWVRRISPFTHFLGSLSSSLSHRIPIWLGIIFSWTEYFLIKPITYRSVRKRRVAIWSGSYGFSHWKPSNELQHKSKINS